MTVSSYTRGHKIIWNGDEWAYVDNGSPISEERPCTRCDRMPTPEGHDACLGYISGAKSACCGHGVEKPYIRR